MSASPWIAVLLLGLIVGLLIVAGLRFERRHLPVLIGLALLAPLPVLAADGVGTIVNLSDLAATIAALVLAAIAAALRGLVRVGIDYLTQRARIELDESTRLYLEDVIYRGITWARGTVEARVATLPLAVDVKSAVVAAAVQYVQQHVPDALDHFGLSPEGVERMVLARIHDGDTAIDSVI